MQELGCPRTVGFAKHFSKLLAIPHIKRALVTLAIGIEPGGQVDLDVAGGAGRHPAAFDLSSDGEVIVSRRFQLATGEVTDALAIPEVDGVVTAPPPPRG